MKVAPIVSTERIQSIDVLRGVALLGILAIHVCDFGSPGSLYPTAAIAGDDRGANLAVWFITEVLFEGKMRALFTMLFGASVILSLIFYSYGLGLYGKFQRYQLLYVLLAVWVFQLIASFIWLRHFRFGPMEWLWRSLSYWQRQPMRAGIKFVVPPSGGRVRWRWN